MSRRSTRRKTTGDPTVNGMVALGHIAWLAVRVALLPFTITYNLLRGMTEETPKAKATARAKAQKREETARRYGKPGTTMYKEAKRWGTDPRLYED